MPLVAPLKEFGLHDLAVAGGKGANLGELIQAGLPVPDGFAITTDAYARAVRWLDLRIAERVAAGSGASIRADVEAVPVPAALRAAITGAYIALGAGPVAVRSSATAEDLPGAAFAGQQDTYLNIIGEDAVIDAVRRCWGSLWTERALDYRARLGIDSAQIRMAVVVQRMVDADVAGVMFTADPVSGDRATIVVDASSGLGEAVVSGLVTPDHYVLNDRGQVREFTPGRREVVIRAAAGGGVIHEPGEPGHAERLPGVVLVELARLGNRVAGRFGRPQDIEWAYTQGQLRLLQARPMTALPPPPLRLNGAQRRLGAVLLDYLPVRPYPIDMTTWIPHGPVGMIATGAARFGIAFEGFLPEDEYGVVDRLVPGAPRLTLGALRAPWRIASLACRHDPHSWTADPRFVEFLSRVRGMAAQDLAAMPWPRLVAAPRRALELITPLRDLRIDYLLRTGLVLLRLLVALRLLRRSALFWDLALGAPTRTADANRALEELAAHVRKDRQLRDALGDLDPQALTAFPDFHAELTAFLAEYGHRETVSPALVTPPTQGESPETVLGLVTVLAAEPPQPVDGAGHALADLLKHPLLRGRRRRARIQRWVEAARAGIAFREDSHFYALMPLPIVRRSLLEIGRRLRDSGVLDEPEEVFHLRLEELEAISDPAALTEPESVRATIRTRSARRDELSGVHLIDPALVFPRHDSGDALISGTPASGGMATGPVMVIREPAEFGRLAPGDVLVCPYTNPAWTPLFQRAAAVVVDSGGPASHAAIVAREYGIPAVMGTVTGTRVLSDGQLVTVDGTAGRVSAAADRPPR